RPALTDRSISSGCIELRSKKSTMSRRPRRSTFGGGAVAMDAAVGAVGVVSTAADGSDGSAGTSGRSSSSKSKLSIVWGLLSSKPLKSSFVSPRTTSPFLSRTTTLTRTSSVPVRKTGGGCRLWAAGLSSNEAEINSTGMTAFIAARGALRLSWRGGPTPGAVGSGLPLASAPAARTWPPHWPQALDVLGRAVCISEPKPRQDLQTPWRTRGGYLTERRRIDHRVDR